MPITMLSLLSLFGLQSASENANDIVNHLPGIPADRSLGTQFAGYASVVPDADPVPGQDALFYWFVGAQDGSKYHERPTVLWTNGGPGSSSFWGFFAENGPYMVDQDGGQLSLIPRPHAWSNHVNYLIVEHPLNVTFSASQGPLPQSVEESVSQWHNAIRNFIRIHPELALMPWLISGESYAGTYLPLLANEISKGNRFCQNGGCLSLQVRAMVLADAWVDPITQFGQNLEYAFSHGLVSSRTKKKLEEYWRPRAFYCGGLGDDWNKTGYCARPDAMRATTINAEIGDISGVYLTNFARHGDPPMERVRAYLNQPDVRKALHVPENIPVIDGFHSASIGHLWGAESGDLQVITSYKSLLQDLLDGGLQVIVVNGLNDAKDCSFLGTVAYLDSLTGEVAKRFHEAETRPWRHAVRTADIMLPGRPWSLPAGYAFEQCDAIYPECCPPDESCDRLLGFVQSADDGGLSFVKVLNTGHLSAADQPMLIDLLLNMTNLGWVVAPQLTDALNARKSSKTVVLYA